MLPELLAVAPGTHFEVFGDLIKETEEAIKSLKAVYYSYFGRI